MVKPVILIVDDEPGFLESLSLILSRAFQVLQAVDGVKALRVVDKHPLSLILLDLDMPVMNGVEFLQELRGAGNKVPVIVLTGRSSHEWAMRCADLGVQGYLGKLTDPEKLINKISRLLKMEDHNILRSIWKGDYEERLSFLSPLVRKTLSYIQENYYKELAREDIAYSLNVTPAHLTRQFHKECGIHLKDYINMLKVCKCKECLMDFERKIGEIGPEIGIPNANYLSRLFKKYTGLTPQEFRKNHLAP